MERNLKKVYLKCYYCKNLGDDIFIDIISKRYPNIIFNIYGDDNYINKNNIKIINRNLFTKLVNKILMMLTNGKINIETFFSKRCDFNVILGGSMFIEKELNPYEYLNKKKTFILGINFGPYSSEQYYNYCFNYFSDAKDVCFRDQKSYDLFNKIETARIAPDIVFSLDNKNDDYCSKRIIISPIDCTNRFGKKVREKYESFLKQIICLYIEKGFSVGLMSFCKQENDHIVVKRLYEEINSQQVDCFYYEGNINEAIDYINNSSIIVGSRFHANILGIKLNKSIIPIAYSDKTIDALNNLGFDKYIFDIRKIDEWNLTSIDDEYLCNKIDVSRITKEAENHFSKLDLALRGHIDGERK